METSTSFDLNLAIQRWRESLAQSPAFRSENLNDLESHLRDSIATLQTRGLSVEESLLVASRRVGRGGVLETEFGKVNGQAVWLDRLFWMLIAIQAWLFVSIAYSTMQAVGYGYAGKLAMLVPGFSELAYYFVLSLLPALFLVTAVAIVWSAVRRSGGSLRNAFLKLSRRPMRLALVLFLTCLSFRLAANCMVGFYIYPVLMNNFRSPGWLIVFGNLHDVLPQYLTCAILIFIFSRKCLRTRGDLAATC